MAFYLGQALADSTKKSYKSAKRRYHSFCTVHNINPLPVCEQSLSRYAASLANEGLAHTSIKCYMSAVRHLHIEEGWGDPKLNCMPKLELVMRGIKRVQGRKHKPSPRQPITPELLRKLREVWLRPSAGGAGGGRWHHVMGSGHIMFLWLPAVGGNHCPLGLIVRRHSPPHF